MSDQRRQADLMKASTRPPVQRQIRLLAASIPVEGLRRTAGGS